MTFHEDEIELRPYILALLHHWRVVVLAGLIGAVAFMVFSLVQKKTYSSIATILVTRTSANLSLAEQFPTVKEPVDTDSRMSAFLSIAQNDSIAIKVKDQVKDLLFPRDEKLDKFRKRLNISNQGDAILITATANFPQLAADIANRWAKETVTSINSAYASNEPLAVIQTEKDAAQQEYNTDQANLEAFMKDNQIDLLNARINKNKGIFDAYANDTTWQISYWNQRRLAMEKLINQADALKKQLQSGSSSTAGSLGDALAVMMARFNAPSVITQTLPSDPGQAGIELNLQINDLNTLNDNPRNSLADIEALLERANDEKAIAEAKLESLRSEEHNQETIEEIAAQTRVLEADLESQKARFSELANKRNLALNAYQTLLQKVTEIETAPQTSNEVTLAEPATLPQIANPRNTLRNTLVGGMLGLVVGIIAVITLEWWQRSDFKQGAVAITKPAN